MINSNGEWIYTNAEIAYELGISPTTVNAIGKRLFGNRIPHWTLDDAKLIAKYIQSISVEEEARRLSSLHEAIQNCGMTDEVVKERFNKDIYLAKGAAQ